VHFGQRIRSVDQFSEHVVYSPIEAMEGEQSQFTTGFTEALEDKEPGGPLLDSITQFRFLTGDY
jgi:hypothetical protein